jgi:methyl-accepting chemotaxis protein/methyl-accepting chemotaxis protein-1 (serine sensor receptor)
MKHATISTRIITVNVVTILLTLVLGFVSYASIRATQKALASVTADSLPGLQNMSDVAILVQRIRGDVLLHMAEPTKQAKMEIRIASEWNELEAGLLRYEKTVFSPDDRRLLEAIGPPRIRFKDACDKIYPLSRARQTEEAMRLWNQEAGPAVVELTDRVVASVQYKTRSGTGNAGNATAAAQSAAFWTMAIAAIACLLSVGLSWLTVIFINRELRRAASRLTGASAQIVGAARQVSESSQSLARGASEQAASVEETSASIEQISAMATSNSDGARSVSELVIGSQARVVEATSCLDGMLASVDAISDSSNRISTIIKVIDDIAFQTNILALNAAVEAARAGEAGMGFAVVADEVRSLAHRSAQAAKDTSALIEDSISKAKEGQSRVREVSTAIRAIAESSESVKKLVEQVNSGTDQQAHGIEQVGQAMTQISGITQTTAGTAQESAAASAELNAQAVALDEVVDSLRLLV